MDLKKDQYVISKVTLEKVFKSLERNFFYSGQDGDEYNNDDVMEAHGLLEKEIKTEDEK